MAGTFRITGDTAADDLLESDGFALIVGMLLDQQVPMEWAFRGPATLRRRLGHLDPGLIAARDRDEIVAAACQPPAIHRFPAVMARRIHAVSRQIVDDYDGSAEAIWSGAADATALYRRLRGLEGFGDEKSKIFIALLAKRFGHEPDGWEQVAAPFSDDTPRSAADVAGPDTLTAVREWKRTQRARGKSKQD